MPCKMQTFLVMLFISSIVFKTVISFTSTISHKLSKTPSRAANTKMSTSEPSNKIIAILRHGQTECNEYLHGHEWGCENFKDPELWDTRLSKTGIKQASLLNYQVLNNNDIKYKNLMNVDLFVSSPLTRALSTTEYVFRDTFHFESSTIPKIALPLAAERVYLSSDVGRNRQVLMEEFPKWDFTMLPLKNDLPWWYKNVHFKEASRTRVRQQNQKYFDNNFEVSSVSKKARPSKESTSESTSTTLIASIQQKEENANFKSEAGVYIGPIDSNEYKEWRPKGYYAVAGEPTDLFRERILKLKHWLEARPEKFILLTCHWGVARALTGDSFLNCEIKFVPIQNLLSEPYIDDT